MLRQRPEPQDASAFFVELAKSPHARLLILQVLLLRPNHAAWSNDSKPGDGFVGSKVKVLHEPERDQRACATEACKAVDRKRPLGKLGRLQELFHYRV